MIGHLWKTMRPTNWIKNLFVFAPLFFSGHLTEADKFGRVFVIFLSFSAMASAVYCLNDIMDRERDRNHPEKEAI
jgi:decaprenyl-phosphate phosphoribosyltransferase